MLLLASGSELGSQLIRGSEQVSSEPPASPEQRDCFLLHLPGHIHLVQALGKALR